MSDSSDSGPKVQPGSGDVGSKDDDPSNDDDVKSAIEVWKQIIAVQMHFNDIEMRIRSLYVTVILAIVAATGWVIEKKLTLDVSMLSVHFAMAVLTAGILVSYLFYFIDRYWYHQLLKGAVEQGRVLDERYGRTIPALGLTSKLSGASPIKSFRRTKAGRILALFWIISPPQAGEGPDDLHSTGKIELFYKTAISFLGLLILLGLLFGGIKVWGKSVVQLIF